MIGSGPFEIDPWSIRETGLDLDRLPASESVFTLANGHIGLRGNLDEGDPHGLPGTYLNSFCELRPLPYAEGGYGYPESGQAIVNVTNGKLIRLLVDDEPLDVRYGQIRSHERVLDFRTGILTRRMDWVSPAGKAIRIESERLVSLVQRSVAAISYSVTALDQPVQLVVQSELFANEELPDSEKDPRIESALPRVLHPEVHTNDTTSATLLHSLKGTGLRMAASMEHLIAGPAGTETHSSSSDNIGRTTVVCRLAPGRTLRITKFLAYGWSSQRSLPALNDQVRAALTAARYSGWDGLKDEQREYLDAFWESADVEIEGDAQLQQAVRFGLFHVLQAGARAEGRAIPAKGLTGPGYDGHTFWDTETFVLPMLSHTLPDAAAHALQWRQSTLPLAVERAETLGFAGAAFPWRTIRGQECSGYWPAGTAALHVNADIADAVLRHVNATNDDEFERSTAVELLTATARLWKSVGHHDPAGGFRIDGVTGPDEYSAIADNNLFTNLMAQRNLRGAAAACRRHPDVASELGVDDEEIAAWDDAADAMVLPYDEKRGVHAQAENFTNHAVWDFAGTPADKYPLLLHYPYLDLYRKQVVKQADLVLAMQLCSEAFTPEQKQRNFAYYEQITVRDSSLSAATQGVMAAETGHLQLAYEYLCETGMLDLHDLAGNTSHGLHIAALAGVWSGVVAGFGGMRHLEAGLSFSPRLPQELSRITFAIRWRGRRLRVEITPEQAWYSLAEGGEMELLHHGERLTVPANSAVLAAIPPAAPVEPLRQPPGREPLVRRLREARE
ncbi:glycoside hydrolase family 65 protein [Cryptosporangium phraense]|uniref:Glycoside hydrolase family 65 protein n=1 Tax=Cryptosporangium phraense TaxID=2593070 RepID=A0A545AMX9_9ACTN|nr:glycosyl hydrolase family 65 protein [Cryptosporangium phraense]TQS42689.1 glycoside hydrolase family 65 protein [Cryptosporangium phraense]